MTHTEIRDIIDTRIGWNNEHGFALVVDSANQTSDSGRFFDEELFVRLEYISYTAPKALTNSTDLNAYLSKLRLSCVSKVITEVFEVVDIPDNILEGREHILDNLIIKRMALIVGETILSSPRSNRIEAITKEFMQNLFYQMNGEVANVDGVPTTTGIRSAYYRELAEVKQTLGQVKMLSTNTFRLPHYENENDISFYWWRNT